MSPVILRRIYIPVARVSRKGWLEVFPRSKENYVPATVVTGGVPVETEEPYGFYDSKPEKLRTENHTVPETAPEGVIRKDPSLHSCGHGAERL